MTFRKKVNLFFYNLSVPWKNYRFKKKFYKQWIKEGKDPDFFPLIATISSKHIEAFEVA